ncbi:MAG: pyrroline-5-carboxylate reductase [Candidatus Omnitrophota bacterium]
MTKKAKIGIIGCGNMGSAIAKGISSKYQVFVFDKDTGKTKNIAKVKVAKSISDLINAVGVVILAVKPQDFDSVLNKIRDYVNKKLVISIAAGISTKYIEKVLGRARVIRVMPNLPAKIGKGMSCLSKGKFASKTDLNFAEKIFGFIGNTLVLKESMMNAATADSGSGPGFLFSLISGKSLKEAREFARTDFIPRLLNAGVDVGFKPQEAQLLATATTAGSLVLLGKSNLSAEDLVKRVASKGGTTEAGLKELKGNVKNLPKAVKAALKRAKELSRR